MRIALLGAPGSGKGTQGARIACHLGVPHLSTGELLRTHVRDDTGLGRMAKPYMEQGELVPDQVMVAMVRERLTGPDAVAGCVLDGYPRNQTQAQRLADVSLDAVVWLDVPPEEALRRLGVRGEEEGREDDQAGTVRRRVEIYEQNKPALREFYRERGILRDVDAVGTIEQVTERTLAALG